MNKRTIGLMVAVIILLLLGNWIYAQKQKEESKVGTQQEKPKPAKKAGEKVWEFDAGAKVTPPAFSKGKIWFWSDKKVYCLDATTGNKTSELLVNDTIDSVTINEDQLYLTAIVSKGKWKLLCLNADTGKKNWEFPFSVFRPDGPIVLPTIYRGNVYIGTEFESQGNPKLSCLNAKTGEKVWESDFGVIFAPIVAVNDKIYATSVCPTNMFYCFDAKTGAVQWKYNSGHSEWSPAVFKDCIYGMVWSKKSISLCCLDNKTGKEIWISPLSIQPSGCLAVDGKQIYIIGHSFENGGIDMMKPPFLYCSDKETGKKLWEYQLSKPNPDEFDFPRKPSHTKIAIAGEQGYVASGNYLFCLDITSGKKLWEFSGENIITPPIISESKVYFGDGNKVYCLETGNPKATGWNMECGGLERGGYNRNELNK